MRGRVERTVEDELESPEKNTSPDNEADGRTLGYFEGCACVLPLELSSML